MAEVIPAELVFKFQLNKQLLATITINNPNSSRLAFKIKTTAPKKYVVRPSSGVADPNGSVSIQVIMQAQKEYPTDYQNCKDKFMVQTTTLADGEELADSTFFKDSGREMKEARLKVLLESPAMPPSPVKEGIEPETQGTASRPVEGVSDPKSTSVDQSTPEVAALKSKIDQMTKERDGLRRKIDMIELNSGSGSAASTKKASPMTMVHILVASILAFIIGHYLRASPSLPASDTNITEDMLNMTLNESNIPTPIEDPVVV